MGRASSAKKIQRVRNAGVRRGPGRRPINAFVVAVIALMMVGGVAVAAARHSRVDAQVLEPVANQDQWHDAFGIYDCDHYLDALSATPSGSSTTGITAGDGGLISIEPTTESASGRNAQLHLFSDAAGLDLTADSFAVSNTTYHSGDTCGSGSHKRSARVELFVWPPQANAKVSPKVVTGSAIPSYRFTEDQQILALALVPSGTRSIPLPSSISALRTTTTAGSG